MSVRVTPENKINLTAAHTGKQQRLAQRFARVQSRLFQSIIFIKILVRDSSTHQ